MLGSGGGNGEDIRPAYQAFRQWLDRQPENRVSRKSEQAENFFRKIGITFNVYGEEAADERLIPFDLVTRDILHDRWHGAALVRRMGALILAGALLTCVASWDAKQVALASFAAFAAAGTANALVFHRLLRRTRYFRMNASNLAAASVDSIVFPLVAFGVSGTSLSLCVAQAASKFFGGLLWSAAFLYYNQRSKP